MNDTIIKAYDKMLLRERKRKAHKQEHYHASGAGMCLRKHYFAVVEGVEQAPPEPMGLRRMQLGTIVHEDIQKALTQKEGRGRERGRGVRGVGDCDGDGSSEPDQDQAQGRFLIEEDIKIKDYNVSGRIDVYDREINRLTDIKTIGAYKWKKLFGRDGSDNSVENYKMQVGTYALGLRETYGVTVEQLVLLFYKLGDPKAGDMRGLRVPLAKYLEKADEYWAEVNEYKGDTPPKIKLGSSPQEAWECNLRYCPFFGRCGGGIKGVD